jgi:hypothetical protein
MALENILTNLGLQPFYFHLKLPNDYVSTKDKLQQLLIAIKKEIL